METPFYKRQGPAVGLALAAGVVAHTANVNAAKAIGRSVVAVAVAAMLLAMLLAFLATH